MSAHTTETALDDYECWMRDVKGNKTVSSYRTRYAVERFFPEPMPLALLTEKKCRELYQTLIETPSKKTKKKPAADTHRNILLETRTFLNWCVEKGWMKSNPTIGIKGVGKRNKRKAQLRIKDARAWYTKAMELAAQDDHGAIAALCACILGMRASEIVSRRVGDLDEDDQPCDLLWSPDSKTPAGRRTLEVPEELRPFLVALSEGKARDMWLFPARKPKDKDEKVGPHDRDWVRDQVKRICDLVKVPVVTAHGMRGLLATLTLERGVAGYVVAATLGHTSEKMSQDAYATPGAADRGRRKQGLKVIQGGKK